MCIRDSDNSIEFTNKAGPPEGWIAATEPQFPCDLFQHWFTAMHDCNTALLNAVILFKLLAGL